MRHFLVVVALALVGTACDTYSRDDILFRRAIPLPEDIAIEPPGAELEEEAGEASQTSALRQGLSVCVEDSLRCEAQNLAVGLNGLSIGLLQIIDTIQLLPPSRRDAGRRVWGPTYIARDDRSFRFEMVKNTDGRGEWDGTFTHCLHIAPGRVEGRLVDPVDCTVDAETETGLRKVLSGIMVPGSDASDIAQSGSGKLILDANTLADLTGDRSLLGVLTIAYDNSSDPKTVSIDIADVTDEADNVLPANASYAFVAFADRSGRFDFVVNADLHNPTPLSGPSALETFAIRSRWQGDGAGRAEADITGGDLGTLVWDVTECWSADLETSWRRHADPAVADIGTDETVDCPLPAFP